MPRATGVWLLSAVACMSILRGESYTRFDDSNSSVTLPNWRTNTEYVTQCDFNENLAPLCGWTAAGLSRTPSGEGEYHLTLDNSVESPSGLGRLESDLFNTSEVSCLEFWYHVPAGLNSTELRVLLRSAEMETGEMQLWSSSNSEDTDAWRQQFIPLGLSEMGMQVVFEMAQELPEDGEVAIDNVGIREGQCGEQCQDGSEFWTDDFTHCVCSRGRLSCSPATCPEGHTCQSAWSARPKPFGTCIAHRKPRYTTFDGVNFPFVGPCTYVMTRTCDQGTTARPLAFSVEVKNKHSGNSSVSSVLQVNVNLKGINLSMLRKKLNQVMVNGMWRNLPLSLDGGTITIKRNGSKVVLETDLLLTVSYHASGEVQVTVPSKYSDKLCGMCGNFNHIKGDDFRKPDGLLAADADALGQSWQSGSTRCEAPPLPDTCLGQEELEPHCGVILAADGPFAACSGALSAESFFASCMQDMCASQGDPESLCDVLNTYANTCRQAGITVSQWRNSTFCPLVCGENSHYNACASGCPAACSSMDMAEACGAVCEERCECDPGFVLSAGRCVPVQDCGCWVDGEHYEKGVTFMTGQCDKLCQCMGRDSVLCSASSCSADQVCKVRNGVMGCEAGEQVTCSVYGDPHYITFDGKAYNFQGGCNYTLAKTCGPTPVQFTVTTRNENWGHPTWSALNSVALEVDSLHIVMTTNKRVYVNGAEVLQPSFAPSATISILRDESYVRLDTDFGLSILFNGEHRLFVLVDERYMGQMCGLCGTYSGSQFDDFVSPDGELLGMPDLFGNSWRVADNHWNCTDAAPVMPVCAPEIQEQGFQECRKLFGETFKDCHMFVPPQIYVDSCVYDHCATAGDPGKLCVSLESYVAACEISGVVLGDWREDTVCAIPTTTVPATPSTSQCPLSCNFDNDECGWEQLVQDSFDWTRHSGSTPSGLTGPSSDHTTGSGFYMYLEGTGVVHGDSARMMSPACTVPGTHCLRFWYHIYGTASAMALNVYQLVGSRPTKIWSKSNNQGNSWQEANVEIEVSEPFKIILEGIRGSTEMSDIALDDVSIASGGCGGSSNTGLDSTTLPPVTDLKNPHPVCNLACNFDDSLCAWSQLLTDSFDWTWQSGSTPTLMTGPSSDHTTGGGRYLYVEGDGVHNGDTARILSGECSDPGPQCLQFWYHMYGTADTMGLSVYLLEGQWARGVWTKRNNQGDDWHKAEIDFMTNGPFQIILEGRRGTTELSDVAVDDIFLYRGSCADLVKPEPPSPTSSGNISVSTAIQETTAPPVITETPAPPVPTINPGTPGPSVNPETPAPPVNPETPAPSINPETPAPPVNPETLAPPVNPETAAPPVIPETAAPPVHPETPAPPVNPETPAPPVNPETSAPPVNPDTPAPPVNPETPTPPVNPGTPAPSVNPETPAPPVNPETPAPPINPETPVPPVNPETPAPPVNPGTPVPSVNPETPAPPVNPETPAPPINPETPAPPVNPETPAPPVNPETPAPPVKPETQAPPVNPETLAPPVNPETPAPPVNPGTPAPSVNPETPAPPVNPETPAPPINPETPAPPVNPETPAPPVKPETQAPPVNPDTPEPPINPETPAPPVNPGTPAPSVNPETPAPPINPETPSPPINPETPAPPVNPETPEPPVNPETSAPPVNPETPAPPVNPETPAPPVNPETPEPPVNPETPAPPVNPETPAPTPVNPETPAPPTAKPTTSAPTTAEPVPSCPKNSHYTDCMPACQPTCKHLHGSPHCNVNEPCVGGCVCNDGFVLKDRSCVPIRKCGCQDNKGQNHYFDEVWYTDHCEQRCECEEDDGEGHIECDDDECDGDDICYMDGEGEYTCKSTDFSECTIEEDPEYRTFDDMKHDFDGIHSYVLVQSTGLPKNLPDVYVEGINRIKNDQNADSEEEHDDDEDSRRRDDSDEEDSSEEHGDSGFPRELKIRVYNHTVEFKKNRKLYVDGVRSQPPVVPTKGVKVLQRASRIYLKTDFGFSVEFNGIGKTEIILPHTYKRRVGGLCGNFDGKKKNDMMKPDGSQAKRVKEFGESWRVTEKRLNIRWRRSARRGLSQR